MSEFIFEQTGWSPDSTMLVLNNPAERARLDPQETLLLNKQSRHIKPAQPLSTLPASDQLVVAMLSLPSRLVYLDSGQTALDFGSKYALTQQASETAPPRYGLAAYDDATQVFSRPLLFPAAVQQLAFGRSSLRLTFVHHETKQTTTSELPWSHPVLRPLTEQVSVFVSRRQHFFIDFSTETLVLTDTSRYGTGVLSGS